jgi:hypothetical protein
MDDPFLKFTKVFEQPDAGAAMDRWNEEPYLTDSAIGKFQQPCAYLLIVEIGVFLTDLCLPDLNTRVIFNIVVLAGITFFKDIVNCFTTVAAKRFIIEYDRIATAVFTAMKAFYFIV